jgi:hypothetical protein
MASRGRHPRLARGGQVDAGSAGASWTVRTEVRMSGRITPVKRRTGSRRGPLPALLKAGPSRPADICEAPAA